MPELSPAECHSRFQPTKLEAAAVYDEAFLHHGLGLPYASLAKARRDGSLRHAVIGKRIFFSVAGSWRGLKTPP